MASNAASGGKLIFTLLKALSILIAGIAGVFGIVADFRKDGRVTRGGWIAIALLSIGLLTTLVVEIVDRVQSEAQQADLATSLKLANDELGTAREARNEMSNQLARVRNSTVRLLSEITSIEARTAWKMTPADGEFGKIASISMNIFEPSAVDALFDGDANAASTTLLTAPFQPRNGAARVTDQEGIVWWNWESETTSWRRPNGTPSLAELRGRDLLITTFVFSQGPTNTLIEPYRVDVIINGIKLSFRADQIEAKGHHMRLHIDDAVGADRLPERSGG